jgi:hypothetical protein
MPPAVPGRSEHLVTEVPDVLRPHPKLKQILEPELQPGEQVHVVIEGAHGQWVVGTNRRALVVKKGMMAGSTFGKKVASWEHRNMTGIQLDSHMTTGVLIVRAAGEESVNASYWATGKGSAKDAPNAITFGRRPSPDVQASVARLRELISHAQSPAMMAPPAGPDGIEQLKRLAELRDAGVVSTTEFEEKKRELLGRI